MTPVIMNKKLQTATDSCIQKIGWNASRELDNSETLGVYLHFTAWRFQQHRLHTVGSQNEWSWTRCRWKRCWSNRRHYTAKKTKTPKDGKPAPWAISEPETSKIWSYTHVTTTFSEINIKAASVYKRANKAFLLLVSLLRNYRHDRKAINCCLQDCIYVRRSHYTMMAQSGAQSVGQRGLAAATRPLKPDVYPGSV